MRINRIALSLCLLLSFACSNEENGYQESMVDTSIFITTSNTYNWIDISIDDSIFRIKQDTVFPSSSRFKKVFRCPSVVLTNKGTMLISSENRESLEDKGKIDVLIARKACEDEKWTIKRVFSYDETLGRFMNPVFLIDGNKIYLFAGQMKNDEEYGRDQKTEEADFVYKISEDDGQTWSESKSLKEKWDLSQYSAAYPSASNGISLSNGTLLLPTMFVKNNDWYAGLLVKQKGKDFFFTPLTPSRGDNESTVYIDNNENIILDCRTYEKTRRRYYYNLNNNSFSETVPPTFAEDCITPIKVEITKDREVFFMGYPDSNLNRRDNISLYGSRDGINWHMIYHMMEGFTQCGYSNVAISNNRMVVCFELEKGIFLQDLSSQKDFIYSTIINK